MAVRKNEGPLPCDAPRWNRRELLGRCGLGVGALGLANLLSGDPEATASKIASTNGSPLMAARQPHFRPRARRVVHFFLNGGPSHVDTFDPKPALARYAGQPVPNTLATERKTGAAFASPFQFRRYGQSGIEVSELFARTAAHIDDVAVIRSMYAQAPNHEPSLMLMNCGEARLVRPSMGSWLTWGLGTENQNLPAFVVLCPGGYPIQESQNWQSGFLPGVFQGTYINTKHTEIEKLIENIRNSSVSAEQQSRQLTLLRQLNSAYQRSHQNDARMEARIQSFELAFRMQTEASKAFDVSREPKHIREAYGDGPQARQILIARRLVERGVRFVQVWHGAGQPWDNHDDIEANHRRLAKECDQAIGALLVDLKQRGMLDETIVMIGGEFGRTPTVELPQPGANAGKINGRDHNHWGFTTVLAGGGFKRGHVHGATDEFGFAAVENKVHVHDLQATLLHQLGFDHTRLTYRFAGRDFRLTDVHGSVIPELLA